LNGFKRGFKRREEITIVEIERIERIEKNKNKNRENRRTKRRTKYSGSVDQIELRILI
jgi:hypothetical protein